MKQQAPAGSTHATTQRRAGSAQYAAHSELRAQLNGERKWNQMFDLIDQTEHDKKIMNWALFKLYVYGMFLLLLKDLIWII